MTGAYPGGEIAEKPVPDPYPQVVHTPSLWKTVETIVPWAVPAFLGAGIMPEFSVVFSKRKRERP
jgi:hypothetical protein